MYSLGFYLLDPEDLAKINFQTQSNKDLTL